MSIRFTTFWITLTTTIIISTACSVAPFRSPTPTRPVYPTYPTSTAISADLIPVIELLHQSLETKDAEPIGDLIDPTGVYFLVKWETEPDPNQLYDREFALQLLADALPASDPTCVGYNSNFGPQAALVVFSGMRLDWSRVGLSDPQDDVIGFGFDRVGSRWELGAILSIDPRVHIQYIVDLQRCPTLES